MEKKVTKFATAGAIAALVATSAFAAPQSDNGGRRWNRNRDQQTQQQFQPQEQRQRDQRQQGNRGESRDNQAYPRDRRDNNGYRGESNRGYRDNQRITTTGRISSFSRERDGYRVYLDGGRNSYWIPESRLGGRRLQVGIDIGLGGIFRGGMIDVDAINWPGAYGYGADGGVLRGVIQRVDYRDGIATLQDEASGQFVRVSLRGWSQQLRAGDYVTLEGHWERGGLFDAVQLDNVR